jgi:phosphoribosylformylglycinamidine (FGAM) synthase-like enzyme
LLRNLSSRILLVQDSGTYCGRWVLGLWDGDGNALGLLCSAGIGQIDHQHLEMEEPQVGMLIVKIGGPAYRIGMGGGAASSVPSGALSADLDFNAVQVCAPML